MPNERESADPAFKEGPAVCWVGALSAGIEPAWISCEIVRV